MQKKKRLLNWEKYNWRQFEKICFEYIKVAYSAEFYKRYLTRERKDSGRDIIIRGRNDDFEAWGECKNHKRNPDLSVIGKNVVLALSHQINKVIFFSVTPVTLNTKIEILNVSQQYGFEVLFLDGEILDETILNCQKVSRKYFRKEYEEYIQKNMSHIWIDTFLSEYPFAEDAKNNTKRQYHLHNDFQIFLHIFLKNMRNENIRNISIQLKAISEGDVKFYETSYTYSSILEPYSDLMYTFRGIVFSSKKNIQLPCVEIFIELADGSTLQENLDVGVLDASDVWRAPYINSKSAQFLYKAHSLLSDIVPDNYTRVLYLYGNSGTGKSRLMSEIENKAYECSYHVIHIDFREKEEIIAIKDLVAGLLHLPLLKNKIKISFNEFYDIFKQQLDDDSLNTLYMFLYDPLKKVEFDKLTNAITNILANNPREELTLIGLDNIQELSPEFQKLFWNILEYSRTISIPVCFILANNQERYSDIHNILIEYLNYIESKNVNFILTHECDVLSLKDATTLMQQLLRLTSESQTYIKEILGKNGSSPMDVLLLSKGLSQIEELFYETGNSRYIMDSKKFVDYATKILASTDLLINNRLENLKFDSGNIENYWSFFSLLCLFDGNLPFELYEKCLIEKKILHNTNRNLITKSNYKDNIITFYHEKFYLYFSQKNFCIPNILLRTVKDYYEKYNQNNVISRYTYVKVLIALKDIKQATVQGMRALEEYEAKHQNQYIDAVCELLLEIIQPNKEPEIYFRVLFAQADTWLEHINISSAEQLFEKAKQFLLNNLSVFDPNKVSHFFHRYVNQKLHTLQYDEALNALNEYEQLNNLPLNAYMIINDRYCVALYSLGNECEALIRIDKVISCAKVQNNYTWLSIAHSDKAFTYFFNSRSIEKIVSNFSDAIEYYKFDIEESVSRRIEIYVQTAIMHILKGDMTQAITNIQSSIAVAKEKNHEYLLIPSFNIYAFLQVVHNNLNAAIEIMQSAFSCANITSNEKALISIYNNLGNIYIEQNAFIQAMEYYCASYQILKKLCKPSNSLRYRGFICNIIKLATYMNNEKLLNDITSFFTFENIEYYTDINNKTENISAFQAYGLLAHNGWDYLYY